MPIFNDELLSGGVNRDTEIVTGPLGSPVTRELNTNLGGYTPRQAGTGLSLDELAKMRIGNTSNFDSPFQMVPRSELLENKKYALYERDKDLENIYGLQQSWGAQLGNGFVKMAATAAGTFAQSFATIPNTISSIQGGVKELSGGEDGYEGAIDNWLKNIEDIFPNYYTRQEQEHPFLAAIPGFAGSANFWGDKIVKNIGFTVGAIGGAVAQDAIVGLATGGIGEIPLIASQIGKASLWLNKIFTGTNKVDKVLDLARAVGKSESQLLTIQKLGQAAAAVKVTNGARYALGLYGSSRTEAAVEARDGFRQVKDELLRQYKVQNFGADPTPAELEEIENTATDAMNTRFGINMALLTVSNAIQFDNLFKSFTVASKSGVQGSITKEIEEAGKIGLKEGSLDVFEQKAATGLAGRVWETVRPKMANIFTEGVYEEGGQFAAERGTYDYYTRKYRDPSKGKNVETWNSLNEVISSTTKGLSDQFNTTQGIENMLVGGISAMITGGIMGKIDQVKGRGKEARLQHAINSLNQYGLTGILDQKYTDTLNAVNIAKEMDEAAKSGNIFKYKNLKHDMFFGFVKSRVSTGMHDVTIEQLNMLKDLSKEEFEKTFGMDFSTSNRETVAAYVDKMISSANNIHDTITALDATFQNPFKNVVNPETPEDVASAQNFKTFNDWKTDLAYYASVAPDINDRLNSINQDVITINPLLNNDILATLTRSDTLLDLSKQYEEQADQLSKTITDFTTPEDKRRIKNQVKELRTLSEKINLAKNNQNLDLKLFNQLLNFELNGRDSKKDAIIPNEKSLELFKFGVDINRNNILKEEVSDIYDKLSDKEGFEKYFAQAQDIANQAVPEPETIDTEAEEVVDPVYDFKNSKGVAESPEIGREYELPSVKSAKVRKMGEDRFKVTAPNGDVTFYPTREKAKEVADEMNMDLADLTKVKVIATNPDGTVKVEDLAGNIQNISPAQLAGYERLQSDQEKLAKDKEQLDEEQKKIELESPEVATGDPTTEVINTQEVTVTGEPIDESYLKDESIYFISGTSPSENESNSENAAIHVRNSREFLNNAKNFKNRDNLRAIMVTANQLEALNLNGVAQISYGVPLDTPLSDIQDIFDVDKGLVLQLFVDQDEQTGELHVVNKNGERIGKLGDEGINVADAIFQTMPTTELYYTYTDPKTGQRVPRFRENQRATFERRAKAWEAKRRELFNAPGKSYKIFSFTISRGLPFTARDNNGQFKRSVVGGVLIPEEVIPKVETLIQFSKEGTVSHQGRLISFPTGRPVLQYGDTLEFLNNTKFGRTKAIVIYEIIKAMADDIKAKSDANQKVTINPVFTNFLQNLLYWKKGGATQNQIYVDTIGMNISLGGVNYPITQIADYAKQIVDQLTDTYHNVNGNTLKFNFHKPFIEYYIEDNQIKSRQWTNYQEYLLGSKTPDGKSRNEETTPLVTNTLPPTSSVPYTHKQKYATMNDLDLPIQNIPETEAPAPPIAPTPAAPAAATTSTKIGEYDMDGKTPHVYQFGSGPVEFTGTVDAQGNIAVDVKSNDTIKNAAENAATLATIDNVLQQTGKFNAEDSAEERVATFVADKLIVELVNLQKAETAKAEQQKPEEKKEEVSDIDISNKINSLPDSVYNNSNNTGLFLDVIINKTKDYKQGADINQDGFIVNFSGVDSKDDIKLTINSVSKEGDNYRIIGKGKVGAKADTYNFLVSPSGDILSITSTDGKTFSGKTNADIRPTEAIRKSIQSTSNKELMIRLASLSTAPVSTETKTDIEAKKAGRERIIDNFQPKDKFKSPVDSWGVYNEDAEGNPISEIYVSIKENNYTKEELLDIEDPENPAVKDTLNEIDRLQKLLDAELAALEGKEVQPPINDKPLDTDEIESIDDPYMRVANGDLKKGVMDSNDVEILKAWQAENLQGIPLEILENLVNTFDNEKAFGVFEDGVAKFYKAGPRSAPYHELFHAIWRNFLTPEQREALTQEFRNKSGKFTDRASGKKINYADATDEQVEERYADDFGEFKAGKLPARTLTERVLKFFRNIIEFVKKFVGKPSLKKDLFKAINEGKFKDYKLPENVKEQAPAYMRIPGLTESQVYEIVEDMKVHTSGYIFGKDKKALYNIKEITGQQIYDRLVDVYKQKKMYDQLGEERFNQLFIRLTESFRPMRININAEEVTSINDENSSSTLYAPEPFSVDSKKNAPFAIKFIASTLPQTVPMNQENSSMLEMPKRLETAKLKSFKLVPFSKVYATLMNKLSNTSSVKLLEKRLLELAKAESEYVRFYKNIGGDVENGYVPFENFKDEDWKLFIEFYQTFTKQKPEALVQYVMDDEVFTAPANQFTASKEVERTWFDTMKTISKDRKSLIKLDNKIYKVDVNAFPTSVPKTAEEMIAFLETLGVDFPIQEYKKLKLTKLSTDKKSDRDRFSDAVSGIYTYLKKTPDIATIKGKTLGINNQLSILSGLYVKVTNPITENTHYGVEGNKLQDYTESNAPSVFENEFNESANLEQLKKLRPELNDVFSENSVVLKSGGEFYNKDGEKIKSFKVSYIEGEKNTNTDKGTVTTNLSLGRRFTQELNQNLNGRYYILIPAESATEWEINLGNHVSFSDLKSNKGWTQVYKIFDGYLSDEIGLALDADNREKLKSVGAKAKELRFMKDILPDIIVKNLHSMLASDTIPRADIDQYVKDNADAIHQSVKAFILSTVEDTKGELINNNQVRRTETGYRYKNLDNTFINRENETSADKLDKSDLTEEDLNNVLTFANVNYVINNIELHKILFGDPYQFAVKNGKLDETKRIKSFLSPRRITFDTPEYNTFLNTKEYSRAGEIELEAPNAEKGTFGDLGYHLHKPYANTVTLQDVDIVGSVALMEGVSQELKDAFSRTNEADAASIIKDLTYREVKLKNRQWSNEAEEWHQWQMAWTRQNHPEYKYTNEALRKQDEKLVESPEPKYTLDVLKPIVTGNKYNKNYFNQVLDKFSQMPMYYSMVKGTNLEKLYTKMWKEDTDYVIMQSGRKEGIEEMHPLYVDGQFNDVAFNNNIQVPWKAYGIQVENAYEGVKYQTRGSQMIKIISVDMFDAGEEVMPGAKQEYDRYNRILDALHQNAYNTLISELGLEDLGTSFRLVNNDSIARTLQAELFKRELSENAKDTLKRDANGEFVIPFEASPMYKKIKDVLYSMIEKSLLSPKMSGSSHVQAPVTLWENAKKGRELVLAKRDGEGKLISYNKISREEFEKLSEEEKKNVKLTSGALKFYENEDGKRHCEVLIPAWFKDKLKGKFKSDKELMTYLNNHPDGKKILSGIGFRIPTQATSSIDVFVVKGFLPSYMGTTVIVPSEITTKSGSDFDIDKLNMYLKSIYIDAKGDIQLVSYKGSEEATKEFYSKVYDDTIKKNIESITNSDEFRKNLLDFFENTKPVSQSVAIRQQDFYNNNEAVINEIISQADNEEISPAEYILKQIENQAQKKAKATEKLLDSVLKEKFVNDMYKKSLENELYDSMEKLLTLPENFLRLISPVTDGGLSEVADEMDKLVGYDESKIKNRLLSRTYMTTLRHQYLIAKKWVGIAATNITGNSNAQKSKVIIDLDRVYNRLNYQDQQVLYNDKILLPHNTVDVNGKSYTTISKIKVTDSDKYISDRLSGYATSFVDVANNPFIMKIVKSNLIVSTFMFLERIGAGEHTIFFLNQPIIAEYLKYLDNIDSKSLFSRSNIDNFTISFFMDKSLANGAKPIQGNEFHDLDNLKQNIKDYYATDGKSLTPEKAREQNLIFDEFLKYAKMAEHLFDFSQATNYDTSRFRSGESFRRKRLRTQIAREKNIFTSVDDLFKSTFLGKQKDLVEKSMQSMGAIFKLEEDRFSIITDSVLRPFQENKYLSNDEFDTIASKVKASFLDYIVQVKLGMNTPALLTGENSVASQLLKAREANKDVKILHDLEPTLSDRIDGAKSIRLRANLKEASDENLFIEMMRELKEINPTLFNNIIKVARLQGSYQSAISINNVMPVDDFAEDIKGIFNTLVASDDIRAFKNGWFQRNNWKDDAIFPELKNTKFAFPVDKNEVPIDNAIAEDPYGNLIYQYTSKLFPYIEALGVEASNRGILLLHSKYDTFNGANEDYLKVPRVVKLPGTEEQIDLTTGQTVVKAAFRARKNAGDLSLRDMFGYQKVKYPDGTPLVTGKGEYVYKLINLYGDGALFSEYKLDYTPSEIDNGTMKVKQELNDIDIIEYYGGRVVAAPTIQTFSSETEQLYSQMGNITQSENVVLPGVGNLDDLTYDGKNFWNEIVPEARNWYENPSHPIIIAYRGNRKKSFLENYKSNTIGNPFDWQKEYGTRDQQGVTSTKKFIEWLITGNNFGEENATEAYRQALVNDFKSGKWKNNVILYYQEKNYATHATALDYLINKYNWNSSEQSAEEEITPEENLQFEINNLIQRIAELQEVQKELNTSNLETIVLNNLPLITPDSARKETGMKTGNKADIKYTLLSGSGVTVDRAAHNIWQNNFGIDSNVTTQDIRDIIIDILSSGSKANYAAEINTSSEVRQLKQDLRDLQDELSSMKKANRTTSKKTVYEKSERIITRTEVRNNPKTLYLFGDNDERKGLGGQAKEMRGEPNTVGVSTKKYPSNNESSFRRDDELENNKKIITEDINRVIAEWNTGKYNKVVVPQIGIGLANLPTRAPQTYAFLQQELNRLEQVVSSINKTKRAEKATKPASKQLNLFAETFDDIKDFTPERKEEILTNFADKHKMTIAQAKEYINNGLAVNREEVINKLKDCY